jgi:hypothetical protein
MKREESWYLILKKFARSLCQTNSLLGFVGKTNQSNDAIVQLLLTPYGFLTSKPTELLQNKRHYFISLYSLIKHKMSLREPHSSPE